MPKSKSQLVVPVAVAPSGGKKKKRSKQKVVRTMVPYHRLLVDPLHASLEGAMKPDLNTRPVVPWREEDALTLTTDAQGNLWCSLRPTLVDQWLTTTLDATGKVTAVAPGNAVNYTELSTTFTEFRPTVLLVQIEYVGEAQLAKGVMYGAISGSSAAVDDKQSMLSDETYYSECRPDNGPVTLKLTETSSDSFTAVNAANAPDPNQVIHVGAIGLPASTACLRIRVVFSFEAVVGHSKLLSKQSAPGPANLTDMSIAANITGHDALVATGPAGYEKMVAHGERIIDAAQRAHGVFQRGADLAERYAPLLALMAA